MEAVRVCGALAFQISQFVYAVPEVTENVLGLQNTVSAVEETLRAVADNLEFHAHPGTVEQEHQERIKRIIENCKTAIDRLSEALPNIPEDPGMWAKTKAELKKLMREPVLKDITDQISLATKFANSCASAEEAQRTAQKTLTKLRKLFVDLSAAGLLPSAIADIVSGDPAGTIVTDNDKETNNADDKENELVKDIEAWKESTGSIMRSVAKGASIDDDMLSADLRWADTFRPLDHVLSFTPYDDWVKQQRLMRRSSDSTADSGISLGSAQVDDRVRNIHRPPGMIIKTLKNNQKMVEQHLQDGSVTKAGQLQKKAIRLREQLDTLHDVPFTFPERAEMEEKLAKIYLDIDTERSVEEAEEILRNLLAQEVSLEPSSSKQGRDAAREARLQHKLSSLYLKLGKLDEAEKIATLATKGRLNINPIDANLVREYAAVWKNVLLQKEEFDEAEGIDDWIDEILEGENEDDARAWCRSLGFDVDSETFRFDVCDSRRSSPLWGSSPLHAAVEKEQLDKVRLMLSGSVSLETPEEKDFATPLLVACSTRNSKIVELLLRHGADVNARDRNNRSALHRCQDNTGGTAVAQLLYDHEPRKFHVDDLDQYKKAAIHMASEMGNTKMLRWLLKHNANVNAIGPGGCTPLMLAIESGIPFERKEMVIGILFENGADPRIQNSKGQTAMGVAKGQKRVQTLLKKHGDAKTSAS
ncbi:hypothetical protein DL766_006106 [Monosporascus sp. MC13-8B]|nr:hypothetical protein DL763_006890 [Monosporascus cannonballus]RYP28037.1 hypothetical protein DL766_006106 [Monosporascus sp. MC13-8B]